VYLVNDDDTYLFVVHEGRRFAGDPKAAAPFHIAGSFVSVPRVFQTGTEYILLQRNLLINYGTKQTNISKTNFDLYRNFRSIKGC
jgi:hypothetical protein